MLDIIVSGNNDPLFLCNKLGKPTILTDSAARKHFKDVSRVLQLARGLTFHDFRHGCSHYISLPSYSSTGVWGQLIVVHLLTHFFFYSHLLVVFDL